MDLLIIEKNFTTCFSITHAWFCKHLLTRNKEETKCKLKVTLLIIKLFFTAKVISQSAFMCWKLTIETLEQGLKYVQS